MKDLRKRFFSGLIGIILLLLITFKGGQVLLFSIYLLSILGLREFFMAVENLQVKPIYLMAYLTTTAIFLNNLLDKDYLTTILSILLISSLSLLVFSNKISLIDISLTVLGILYIPFMLMHINYLDKSKYIWLIFIIAFGTDTFAYLAGNLFGKHKLCPKASPNKTVEGALGGIIGSLILVLIYSYALSLNDTWKFLIFSIIASIFSQLGDLSASRIKRLTKVKDFGYIMPGHGGVLDRFDSIIFVSPLVYYFIRIFI